MDSEQLYKIRHSLAHVMAQAVLQIRPKAKLAFGPPIDNGFYYDFDLETPLTPEDFADIEKRMRRIIQEKQQFTEEKKTAAEALKFLEAQGEQYKVEYAKELIEKGETEIGFYQNGSFVDMCRGPHVEHTGQLTQDGFKLDSIAGAYWRGSEKNKQLTRLYALCFENKKALKEYIEQRELAKQRDHRKLGTELELFTIEDRVGPGLILWLPNGTIIKDQLEKYAEELEFQAGFQRVCTPHISKQNIYYTSGHLPYYKDTMFPPMQLEDEEPYYLKPMNCPHHHLIFGHRPRSYRELPLRLAEYGSCYRFEESGALSGLLRVRMLSMNDAHIYCQPEKIEEEIRAVLEMSSNYYKKFRLGYHLRLSLHDPKNKEKYLDNPQAWEFCEQVLKKVLDESGEKYEIGEGEAAFYGPKIDFQLSNVIGRSETASTVQLDFAGAERFQLTYIAEDGKEHRPYIIHRAPLSTHERFLAFLIENCGGAFPTWMSPVQVKVVPVGESFNDYAVKVQKALFGQMVRAEADLSTESFNKKVRNAVTSKTPNILIVGAKEQEEETITWRRYAVKEQKTMKLTEFQALIVTMIAERTMDNYAE